MTDALMEDLAARLRAHIAERTGLDIRVIDAVLDAQALFWEERPRLLDVILGPDEMDEPWT